MSRPKRITLVAAVCVIVGALVAGGWIRSGGARTGAAAEPAGAEVAGVRADDEPLPGLPTSPRRRIPADDARLAAELPLRPSTRGLLTGYVRLEGGDGVPDVAVQLSLHQGLARRDLGMAVTGTGGRYALALDLAAELRGLREARVLELARIERALEGLGEQPGDGDLLSELGDQRDIASTRVLEPLGLRARVVTSGFAPARAWKRLEPGASGRVRLDLVLERGSGVRGTVFHRGAPLAEARVHLFDEHWKLHASATTDRRGEYVLPLPEPGRFHLHARRDGVGASGTRGYSLGEALPYLTIDLDVDGLAVLYGHVQLFDGTPLPGLRLEALAAAVFAEELVGGPAVPFSRLARAEESGGLRVCGARSDEHGRLVFEGLHEGSYSVRLAGAVVPGVQPFGPFVTGGEEHELVLDGNVLIVEVAPARDGSARFDAPFIELLCLAGEAPGDRRRRPPVRMLVPAVDPIATFVVEPETTWRVLARTAEHTGVGEVRVLAGRHLTRLSLQLGDWDERISREIDLASVDEPGGIEVVVTDESGARLPELAATLWPSGPSGRPWLEDHPIGLVAGLPELPPGIYDLEVVVLGEAAEWAVPLPVRRDLVVASGARTRVELHARRGGRLQVRLHDVFVPRGFESASAVTVVLRDARTGAILERPEFSRGGLDGERVDQLYPGEVGVSPPLAAGRYSVTYESSWFTPASRWVELRAGEVSELAPLLVTPHVDVSEDERQPIVGGDDAE